jgi:hypothetical protein
LQRIFGEKDMKTNKLKVGQKVYFKGYIYGGRKESIEETEITKVGNKYFELKNHWRDRFFVETLMHDGRGYSSIGKVYLTMQEIKDEDEAYKLNEKFRMFFGGGSNGMSLDKLREVDKIIEDDKGE